MLLLILAMLAVFGINRIRMKSKRIGRYQVDWPF